MKEYTLVELLLNGIKPLKKPTETKQLKSKPKKHLDGIYKNVQT